ncbi:MAG: tRNA lysidine(34) synthetase TilS [Paracoccaceae bacterium]
MRDGATDISSLVRDAFLPGPPRKLGVAVSGGGDSVALLHILHHCFTDEAVALHAVTVDHGLRPEAQDEAVKVADLCEQLSIPHSTLRWRGWDGSGNLQDQARQARYGLMTEWAQSYGINDIALGHTADDQAETFLMRLSRASGVDGLSGMGVRRTINGVNMVRPMLRIERCQLRDYLRDNNLSWIDDPSNENTDFDRIKARQALDTLAPLGISVRALGEVSKYMEQAREALNWYSFLAARDFVRVDGGDVLIEHRRLRILPTEIIRRLLSRAILWINGRDYAPRSAALSLFADAAKQRKSATLGGCHMLHQGPYVWICRELSAVQNERSIPPAIWDKRWRVCGPNEPGCVVKPLGRRGILHCEDWRATGRPRTSLLSSPAVWKDGDLIAAPLAGNGADWRAELVGGPDDFFASLLSH